MPELNIYMGTKGAIRFDQEKTRMRFWLVSRLEGPDRPATRLYENSDKAF